MAKLLSTLYERNLFYQQVSFKWKSLIHLKNVLVNLSSLTSLSRSQKTLLTMTLCLAYLSDFIFGWIVYTTLERNSALRNGLVNMISSYTMVMLHWTKELIRWVMGTPGGLKLNMPLNHFLGTKFLSILELWQYFYSDFIGLYLDSIVTMLMLLQLFGLTLSLSAVHDFFKFLNLCLICFFIFARRIISLQFSALNSLARLFMGTKWNILKKRVDSCDYGTNRLLMGTILFTILLFLLPTTGVYFVMFLLLRMLQFVLQLALRTTVVVFNKALVSVWNVFLMLVQDKPITKLNMIVEFKEKTGGTSVTRPADVKLLWNGKQYTVEEIHSVIQNTPTQTILQLLGSSSSMIDHPLLHIVDNIISRTLF